MGRNFFYLPTNPDRLWASTHFLFIEQLALDWGDKRPVGM
jgi:hypothetical protein